MRAGSASQPPVGVDLRAAVASLARPSDPLVLVVEDDISTSMVERLILTVRMQNRRFTRLTNGFPKRHEKHVAALALFLVYYNFTRIHDTLRVSPAMEAGIADELWSMEDLVRRLDERFPPPAGPRGPYNKKHAGGIMSATGAET